jgi:hypothetical protein
MLRSQLKLLLQSASHGASFVQCLVKHIPDVLEYLAPGRALANPELTRNAPSASLCFPSSVNVRAMSR